MTTTTRDFKEAPRTAWNAVHPLARAAFLIVRLIVSLFVDETHASNDCTGDTRDLSFPYDWPRDIYEFLAGISSRQAVAELLEESDECPPPVAACERAFPRGDRSRLDVSPWFVYFYSHGAPTFSTCLQKRLLRCFLYAFSPLLSPWWYRYIPQYRGEAPGCSRFFIIIFSYVFA